MLIKAGLVLRDCERTNQSLAQIKAGLKRQLKPLIRDPCGMSDLLSYQLISGVTAGRELAK